VAWTVSGLPVLVQHRPAGILILTADGPSMTAAPVELLSDATLCESMQAGSYTTAMRFGIDRHLARIQIIYRGVLSCSELGG